MQRLLDLVKSSALPSNLMYAAARGALSVPASEMLEILVYLTHNPIFGAQAKLTLAGWDEKACIQAVSDPNTPHEVLEYFIDHDNLRTHLLPALLENPASPKEAMLELAATGSREIVDIMLASPHVNESYALLNALLSNPQLEAHEAEQIAFRAEALQIRVVADLRSVKPPAPEAEQVHAEAEEVVEEDPEVAEAMKVFETTYAEELATAEDKPYRAIGGVFDAVGAEPAAEPAAVAKANSGAAAAAAMKKKPNPGEHERVSVLQKIARLDIKGRIHLAMRGSKEERAILVRDGTKLVALAVLDSPKVSDGEVENFASQKNVLEAVLRAIPMKRRFVKNYNIVRNLTFNPRTPLDVSLGLMKNMLVNDLRILSSNKEVSETIRKLALKMFKQKTDTKKKASD